MEDIHIQNLNLDPEELHYLCQETNRPHLELPRVGLRQFIYS